MKVITVITALLLVTLASDCVAQQCFPNFCRDGGTSRTCLKKCRHDFDLMGKCVVPSRAQTKIKTDCCCYHSREQDDYDAEIAFFVQNARGPIISPKPVLFTTVSEDVGAMHICGIGKFIAANTTTAVTLVTVGTQLDIAKENSDYDSSMVPNQIMFSQSDAGILKCFDMKIIDDSAHEGTEYFTLAFDTVANVDLTPRVMYVYITDNDE